ncbi:GPW/gp25 family protein [Candidatus Poribacteria bacterium]|nr:GPW/gp25 family protein [Candidatus Poribacteria bacterium]
MPTEREKLFGNDLRLVERTGGLDLAPDAAGDLDLAQGNDNIIQALMLRLKVRKGELAPLGWPNYGSRIHELIGEPNNSRTHVILMAHARNAIEQDPRVAEVKSVRTQPLPGERNVVRILMEITLINEPNPINLVFPVNLEAT